MLMLSVATGQNRPGNPMILDRKIKKRNKINKTSKKVGETSWGYLTTTRTKGIFHIIVWQFFVHQEFIDITCLTKEDF